MMYDYQFAANLSVPLCRSGSTPPPALSATKDEHYGCVSLHKRFLLDSGTLRPLFRNCIQDLRSDSTAEERPGQDRTEDTSVYVTTGVRCRLCRIATAPFDRREWGAPQSLYWVKSGGPRFDYQQRQNIFPLVSVTRPALMPTQPPIQ
jgi:hypothetical protein